MSIVTKFIDRVNALLSKIPAKKLPVDVNNPIFKFIWKRKEPKITKFILEKKDDIGRIPAFKTYFKVTEIKGV